MLTYFWPEFEVNDNYWVDGKQRGGKNQVLLTPGIILEHVRLKLGRSRHDGDSWRILMG